ncbi:hypothetical protein [Streptomyces sp. NPDC102360]|uniref:hypothetical protein n=1 Tax=Streptomyces sp. NPDC102360 TaxID=3366160 RepID=UPI0038046622
MKLRRALKAEPSEECTAGEDSPGPLAELRGLPSKIVAGSGWHGFTFRVTNMTDQDFASARAQVYAFSFAYEDESAPGHVPPVGGHTGSPKPTATATATATASASASWRAVRSCTPYVAAR